MNPCFRAQSVFALIVLFGCTKTPEYLDPALSVDVRVNDLVSRMTVEEKISQMSHLAPAIERLGIVAYEPNFDNPLTNEEHPDYDAETLEEEREQRGWENYEYWEDGSCLDGGWWNEALHGVARSGLATSFPQSIGLGSTWNPDLIQQAMSISSTEARVHHNLYGKKLTYWSPTINILRDPRWGRNEESYSEDPYLLSRMAAAFVKGFQGDDQRYLKAVATIKHYVANNSEYNRHTGSSDIEERWLREYYLPAFRAAIEESNAYSVMSAYNAVNGVPVSADYRLMTTILRDEWGFEGYVVSDCGAVSDVPNNHKYEVDKEKAVAMVVKAGLDLECETCEMEQFMFDKYLKGAFDKGYLSEEDLDVAVKRLFKARILLGEFDPPEMVPFSTLTRDDLDKAEHREMALQAARESLVLLKNDGALPLDKDEIQSIAVIGPNADIVELGGYSGTPSISISPLEGIKGLVGEQVNVVYSKGCDISNEREIDWDEENDEPIMEEYEETESIRAAAEIAKDADVAILFLGTNLDIANEAADRTDLELPGNQQQLAQAVLAANPNTIVVLINGMALSVNWLDKKVPAILEAWYAGQAQGTAIAEALFGVYNPGGKLPVTFYKGIDDLPPIGDYDITKNRTYWFYENEVLYPFGHGLSYTSFDYSDMNVGGESISAEGSNQLTVEVTITNSGGRKGDEVVQLYIKDKESSVIQPVKRLRKFSRVNLDRNESTIVRFTLDDSDFSFWDEASTNWKIEAGEFEIQLGSSSQDIRLTTAINAIK